VPEGLVAADGKAVPLDPAEQVFAAAMAAPEPGQQADYPAPPRRDPDAPHGRGDDGNPLAPFGLNQKTGRPNITKPGPGRPRTPGDQARVQKPGSAQPSMQPKGKLPAPPPPPGPAEIRVRRAGDAQTTLELLGAGASLFAMIGSARAQARWQIAQLAKDENAGKLAAAAHEKATVLQLDAAACSLNAEPVGASLADLADQNKWAAMIVDRLGLVNGVASVGMAILPLIYQITANHAPPAARDNLPPELMQLGVLPPKMLMEKLQAQNAVKMARVQAAILAEKIEAEAELADLREQVAA
jgi:hypothetical protein